MAEQKPIVISNFQSGLAPSAYLGFEEIRGLDINKRPGSVRPNLALANDSGTTITDRLAAITLGGATYWAFSDDDKVWERTGTNTWAERSAHSVTGIKNVVYWKGYVAVIGDTTIDWYDVSDDSCDTSWGSVLSSGGSKRAVHASDDCLYIVSGRYIDRIEENAGQNFDPGTAGTFTVTANALDLPEGDSAIDIDDMGDELVIASEKILFYWNKTDESFSVKKNLSRIISHIVAYNNNVYVLDGYRGEWVVVQGKTAVLPFSKLPETMTDLGSGQFVASKPFVRNDMIYFCVGGVSTSANPQGVYSLNPRNGAIALEHTVSAGYDGSDYAISFGNPISMGISANEMLIPWESNSLKRVDYVGSAEYSSDKSFLISQFYRVGTAYNKRAFTNIEVQLTKPLTSGDSIVLWYRTAQNGTWTSIGTMSYSTDGGVQSKVFPFGNTFESIQLKIALNDDAELIDVTIR